MNVSKQVKYWTTGAEEDFAAAQSLLEKGHYRHSLFFAHLALEKMLKALVVLKINDVPPKIHNLIRLSELAGLAL
jgi:HEPN domain-containing protein